MAHRTLILGPEDSTRGSAGNVPHPAPHRLPGRQSGPRCFHLEVQIPRAPPLLKAAQALEMGAGHQLDGSSQMHPPA